MVKNQDITSMQWDNLVILDACRFDTFKKIYGNYLIGKLEKRKSRGSETVEWLQKTFTDRYDITYFSTNPFINSQGVPCGKTNWKAKDHFTRIVDVWMKKWDEDIGTVHPKDVNDIYFSEYDHKNIIHYVQPHRPYLTLEKDNQDWNVRDNLIGNNKDEASESSLIRKNIKNILVRLFGQKRLDDYYEKFSKKWRYWEIAWRFRKTLRRDPVGDFEFLWRKYSKEEIIKAYEDNLKIVLESVKELVENTEGKTIVTADHGESFGENGIWGHPGHTHIPVLTEVPWLEIEY